MVARRRESEGWFACDLVRKDPARRGAVLRQSFGSKNRDHRKTLQLVGGDVSRQTRRHDGARGAAVSAYWRNALRGLGGRADGFLRRQFSEMGAAKERPGSA